MKNKEILIVCLIMCFIFSLQAIAASDINATDDTVSIQNNESTLAVPDVDDQLTDDNAATFSDLESDISDGGTITLDKNYTYDDSSDSSLAEGITISKDTALDGQGKVVIDGNHQARIFNIVSGATVTLTGITFINGNASSGNGGSIYSMGALTITDCNFINNTAYKDGGAVYIEGDGCSLSDSTFTDNVAGDDGGAIYWEGSNGKIDNVIASNNKGISSGTSNSNGGTICLTGGDVTINNINISSSSSVVNGGAMFVTGNGVSINDAYLYNCSSVGSNGGALYIIGNNTSLNNILIDTSSAEKGGAIYWEGNKGYANNITTTGNTVSGDGASMYIAGDECKIYNSSFIDTVADDDGGAIYWTGSNGTLYNSRFSNTRGISKDGSSSRGGSISLIGSDVTIDKCNFTDSSVVYNDGADSSKIDGGAIFVTGNDNTISRSIFSKTNASNTGGAIHIIGNYTTIEGCKFDDSNATLGGIIYITGDNTTIDNITSTNTNAEQGGAIYIAGNTTTILNSDISDSETTKQGGAVYVQGDYFTVNGTSFSDNFAVDGGGAIYCIGHYGNVYDSNFTNNIADCLSKQSGGGAIYWSGGSSGDSIDGCIFTNNIAYITESDTGITSGGGAVFWSNGGSGGRIVNSEFYYNTVHGTKDSLGGAINWDKSSNGLIDNCTFEGNAAISDQASANNVWVQGGAVYWRSVNGTISNSRFINCSSDQEAGALYWSAQPTEAQLNTQGYIINCTFEDNRAKSLSNQRSGGAILVKECRNLEIQGCNFTNNTAVNGGALAVTDKVNNVNMDGCAFTDNEATWGGAVYWLWDGNITNSVFVNNSASNEAGALYLKSGSSVVSYVENSTFTGNTAVSKSGAVSSYKKYVNFVNDNFTDNHATGSSATAGAILVSATYNNIINSVFNDNSAVKQAGAISSSSSNLQILDSNFTNNTISKDRGGAVYIYNTNVYNILVNNSNFKSNGVTGVTTDVGLGGALFANANNVTIDYCSFEDNYVNGTNRWLQGGAIAIADNKNVVLNNSYFADNYCEHEGGAVYWVSENSVIENSVFESNTANGAGTGEGYLAGGALYIKSKSGISVNNCNVTGNTGKNGAGIIVYNAKVQFTNVIVENNTGTNGAGVYVVSGTADFTDCEITGNNASGNGGGAYINSGTTTFTNTEFKNNTAENGGGLYTIVAVTFSNATFTQNHAENGGALYVTSKSITLSNFNAYNNTATLGGAVYANSGNKITNATMQYNKADYGSALYVAATGNYDLVDVVLLDNQALALKFTELSQTIDGSTLTISTLFEGGDNLLNAIYNAKTGSVYFTNVTYWSVNSAVGCVANTGSSRITATKSNPSSGDTGIYQTSREAGQNITLTLYDENNNVILNTTSVTDNAGNVTFTWTGDNPESKFIRISHFEDNYYTGLFYSTKNMSSVIIEVEDITYGSVEAVNITVTPANDTVSLIPTGNISVYLNGTWYGNFTLDSEGKYSLNISKLLVGTYPIRVDYRGDAYFLPETNQTSFKVLPVDYEIIIEVSDYNYGNKGNATVKVADYVTGIVTVTINGEEYEIDVTDNKNVTFEFEILNAGNYTAYAEFPESDTYFGSSNSTNFTVFKVNSTVAIEVNYGEVTEIVVTVGKYNCTGNVTIILDGDAVEFILDENGQAVRYVNYLDSGNHTVNATYEGDRNHYAANNTTVFNVDKFPTPIVIDASNITYGENQTIIISVPAGIDTKQLNITFNGKSQNYTVENGTVTIQANGLAAGEYPVSVFYYGDYLYERNSTSKTFWVIKATPEMNVEVEDIVYNETEEHIVAYINQTGNVTIRVTDEDNSSWFVENPEIIIENGKVSWNISTLAGGDYIAEVTYNGNANYTSLTVNKTFTVDKAQSSLTINVTGNRVGETTVINITVSPKKATGDVTVYIDGVEAVYQLNENNEIIIEVDDFAYGNHSVVAIYEGDRNYTTARNSTKFLEDYAEGIFIIEANNITVDENQTVSVAVPEDAEGLVIIDIGDLRYYINLTAGERSVEIPYEFAQGEYDVNGTWINDPKYGPLSNTTNFTVYKLNSTIDLEVADIDYGETEVINVTVDTATGNVTIKVNDTVYENITLVNGVASLPVADLAAGYYEVTVIYPGDNRLNGNETKGNFTVSQITLPIEIVADNITFGEKETITVYVNATGNVTVTVDGQEFPQQVLENGKVEIEVPGYLTAGNYTVDVTYNGNANLTQNTAKANFTVKKADVTLQVSVEDIPYGDVEDIVITVTAVGDAQGNVTITVAGNTTTIVLGQEQTWILKASVDSIDDYEGIAKLHIHNLAVGTYPVTVTYNGNENFNAATKDASFIVYQIDPEMDVEVADINVWDKEIVNVTLNENATGSVFVYVDTSITPVEVPIVNGTAQINLTSLAKGTHIVRVVYNGDNNFTSDEVMKTFEVSLRASSINVTATNITVGETEVINVTIPANATGYVVITGNFTENPIHIQTFVEGNATININDLPAGKYTVVATYSGDGNYTSATANTTFTVSTADVVMDITVESVDYGESANITVTVTGDATGYITIRINETASVTLPIENGKVNCIAEGYAADNYTVYANYSGDGKYNANNANKSFEVRQIAPGIEILSVESEAGKNATVVVNIDSRITGNITVTLNGKDYTVKPAEGMAIVTTDVLENGTYTVKAVYAGDKNFTAGEDEFTFTANKISDYEMNITAADISVGDLTNITVNVPGDAIGIVIVEINGTNYTATISNGKAVFNNETNLPEGRYDVTAYFGNGKYANKTATGTFYISKVDTPMNITISNSDIKVGDNVTVVVKVPSEIDGESVTIEINSVKFTNATVNGTATFTVPSVTYGNKTVVASYAGNGKYVANSTTANFTVTKRASQVNVSATGSAVGGTAIVAVQIPANATGYVVVNVNGTNYTINTTNGLGFVEIEGLGNGTYDVKVTYIGDDQYLPSTNATSFEMTKSEVVMTISVESIDYGESANITITITGDATGYITIRINETAFGIVPIDNGTVNCIAEGFAADNYTIYANYSGDGKYNANNITGSFEIRQIAPGIEILSVVSEAGKNATVVVNIDSRTTENITVTLNGKDYTVKPVDGMAIVTTDVLENGTYTVKAVYAGDKNFTAGEDEFTFAANKTDDYEMNITAADISVGDLTNITVNVPADAVGNVILEINGTNYTATISNGKAVFNNETNLPEGRYDVTAYFGNGKYANKTAAGTFYISKVDTLMNITIINNDIKVGDDVTVVVKLPSEIDGESVTIEINGVKFTNATVNGTATFTVPSVTYGNKTVVASYAGNGKYVANSTTTNFTVTKRASQVNVSATGSAVGGTAIVAVQIPANATGYVVVNVNGTNYTINTTNGLGFVEIEGLGNGAYDVKVTYIGDDQYLPSTNATSFEMTKSEVVMTIFVESIDYGESANITVTITGDATGYITIKINETSSVTLPIENGKVNCIAEGYAADNYTVYANYSGDGKYNANNANKSFEVRQIAPGIEILSVVSEAGKNATVVVNIDSRITGNITVTLNGKDYTVKPAEGMAIVTTDVLENGTYTVKAVYAGDKNFTAGEDEFTFTANKTDDYEMNITAADISVGDLTNITVNVPGDAVGTVILEINGTNYTAAIKDGKAVFNNETNLPEGRYDVTAYFGNGKYANKTATGTFYINKVDTPMNITITNSDIKVGDDVTVVVKVPSEIDGETVTIEINGVKFTNATVNGTATFTVPSVTYGNKTVVASYAGNGKYVANSTTTNFTVTKRASQVNVSATGSAVGGTAIVAVQIPANATGYVVVNVNGTNYTINTTNGLGFVEIEGLGNGTYDVKVTYIGDDQYLSSANATSFEMTKSEVVMTISVESIDYGESANITVTITGDATGYITIKINETSSVTLPIENGKVNCIAEGYAADNYTVYANYSGDAKYNANNITGSFEVRQIAPGIEILSVVSEAGKNATVVVNIDSRTTENITVTLNGKDYTVKPVDGMAIVTTDVLENGTYTVKAVYAGDKNFTSGEDTFEFTANKTDDYEMNITAGDISVGDLTNITVNVPADAVGTVILEINGTNYTATISNGKAVFNNETNLPEGRYDVTAYFGNGKYANKTATGTFYISKVDTPMNITIGNNDIKVGDNVTVIVKVPSEIDGETVTIEINGVKFTNATVNGTATFTVPSVTYGNKTVVASYAGNGKYVANSTTANFTVTKCASQVNVTGDEIKVGETAVVEITAPEDYNGIAVVTVNGTDYSATLTNGIGKVNITGLANGTYVVKVTLSENDKYLESTNDSARIYVSKVESDIDASTENITVGDQAIIKVTLPDDATGNVTVVIGNITKTVPVSGGENEIAVDGVPVGEYDVNVTYNGDDKYDPANTTLKLKVSPAPVNPDDIKVIDQGNGTVVVVVPDNATGNVTVKVGDNNYTAEVVNGTATLDLRNETPGEHDITVIYSGDENHTSAETNATFTRPKYSTPISIEVTNSYVGDTNRIVVTVPSNVTEKVTIEINGVKYTEKVNSTGQAVFEIDDLAYGNKTVTATYDGDDWYLFNSTTAEFVVSRLNSTVSVSAVMSNDTAVITVSDLPSDATGYVVVEVNGVEYGVNITETNVVEVPIKTSGTYNVTATYLGDDKYLGNSNSTTFQAVIDDDVTIEVQNETYNGNVTVKVTVPDDATGNVTVTLDNNTTVVVPVTGGENVITLENVSEGNHSINVTYSGDGKYGSKTVLANVTSYPSIKADNIKRGWNSPYDYMAEFLDAEGHVLANTNVQFKVNGKTYTVKTNDKGIAYLNTSKLAVGTYDITSINPVTGQKVTKKVTIVKRLLKNKSITMDFRDGTYYTVLAIGDDGNPVGEGEYVDIYVNTIHYSCRTDKNGYAKLLINLNPKKYTITADYKLTTVKNKLVVKQTLKLVKKTIKVKKGKKLVLKAKLKWSNGKAIKGKKIVFKFQGKKYTAKTNSKGIAKVTIKSKVTKKYKKGKKCSYSATYVTNTVKGKVKVI